MKVLFAVNNENISNLIVKKYQKEYKEIISSKNVYYFNAILKEIQKDKSYDRIVISEDLEQFTNSNYQQMDKFIFDRLDSISDEASNMQGEDIPIILICSERRTKGEENLVKLFGIGIYNAVIGKDRDINEVCRLIHKPRSKKEAKEYYRIDTEDVNYQPESENDVSEIEIQNILAHYKRLGKNEEKYVESFDNIALQYNDIQLKIICKFLPLNVRAVLEEKSPRYQKLMAFNKSVSAAIKGNEKKKPGTSERLLITPNSKPSLTRPVVIPTTVKSGQVKKLTKPEPVVEKAVQPEKNKAFVPEFEDIFEEIQNQPISKELNEDNINFEDEVEKNVVFKEPEIESKIDKIEEPVAKRGRGRPKKVVIQEEIEVQEEKQAQEDEEPKKEEVVKKGRGRPKKIQQIEPEPAEKQPENEDDEEFELPGFDDMEDKSEFEDDKNDIENILNSIDNFEEEDEFSLPGFDEDANKNSKEIELPGFDDEEEIESQFNNKSLPGFDEGEKVENQYNNAKLPGFDEMENDEEVENLGSDDYPENPFNNFVQPERTMTILNEQEYSSVDISGLLSRDKKIVTFVGTSKNGTSFVLNNLAELLSSNGINVAILDATQNRNSYYIYTKNQEDLRRTAFESIKNLTLGNAKGIEVNNNLTIYTSLPSENNEISQVGPILETLLKKHSLILIDCDFKTPIEYFANSQEIYLVQSMDVLTIQPLTAFLRELKTKNVLEESKIRIIINKFIKLHNVSEKAIIGGMAYYNDPAMSFMTELFDRNSVKYITVPFEEEIYAKYLEGLINCDISLKGYSKNFMQVLKQLGNSVYPLISGKTKYRPQNSNYQSNFSPNINNTLNQMKKNY